MRNTVLRALKYMRRDGFACRRRRPCASFRRHRQLFIQTHHRPTASRPAFGTASAIHELRQQRCAACVHCRPSAFWSPTFYRSPRQPKETTRWTSQTWRPLRAQGELGWRGCGREWPGGGESEGDDEQPLRVWRAMAGARRVEGDDMTGDVKGLSTNLYCADR
jgi:hypothetical protein